LHLAYFDFLAFLIFELEARTAQTDRQTDRPARPIMRPLRRPHNQ